MTSASDAIGRVHPSATMAVTATAAAMKRAGADVLALSAGEPDFETPSHIREAAINAIHAGQTRYTGVDGTPELKEAVARFFTAQLKAPVKTSEVAAGSGGKQLIFNALLATLNKGDEVIIPAPYWVSYPEIVRFAGAQPVILPSTAESGWRIDPERLAACITPKSKWLILCSPSNPTGVVLTASELSALAEILRKHPQLMVLSDDLYSEIVYPPHRFTTLAAEAPDLAGRILTLNGVSKSWAMTGWRIGFATGPEWLINLMRKLQSHTTSCPAAPSQAAALAALTGPQDFLSMACARYQTRRDLVVAALDGIEGIRCPAPEGAFYAYLDVADLIGLRGPSGQTLSDDVALATALLEETGVALVPGAGFGGSPALRLSFATSDDMLHDATTRIAGFIGALR